MNKPEDIIDITMIENLDLYYSNVDKSDSKKMDHCPCCGRILKDPKYGINSIYGGCMYKADDKGTYSDAWVMGVGSECRKKFPEGYVFKL